MVDHVCNRNTLNFITDFELLSVSGGKKRILIAKKGGGKKINHLKLEVSFSQFVRNYFMFFHVNIMSKSFPCPLFDF